jgi:hypothetical protein
MRQDAMQPQIKVRKYWIARSKLMLAGLLAIILIILQDLITSGVYNSSKMFDVPLLISAIAFAIALPLLSVQLLATFEDESRITTIPNTPVLTATYWIATLSAITGIVATFWHILPLIGILSLVTMVIGGGVYTHYRAELRHHDKQYSTDKHTENIKDYEDVIYEDTMQEVNQ